MNEPLPFPTEYYSEQVERWPREGRHILACADDDSVLVYQAYRPEIGQFASRQGHFGGEFRYSRMSWIKPNFLWMMYRSNWGRSQGQETVLAIRLRRTFFESLLQQAIPSSFDADQFGSQEEWKTAVSESDVRLQWDPDHLPDGTSCDRRAIQIGLRGQALEDYGRREALEITDISNYVAEQRSNIADWKQLVTPREDVYIPESAEVRRCIGLD